MQSMPVAPSLRVRRYASRIHSPSMGWCRDVNTRCGRSLACSAIHCCFVYVFPELSVSSIVSHQWVRTSDAPLPSGRSRWPRFPAFTGTIRTLRLPAPHVLRLIVFASRLRRRLPGSCPPSALPPSCGPDDEPGSGLFSLALPFPAFLPAGRSRISQVPWRSIPRLCADPRPRTTRCASPVAALPVLPPRA